MVFEAIFLGLVIGGGGGYFIHLKHRKKERDEAMKRVKEGTLEKVKTLNDPPKTNKNKKSDLLKSKSKNHTHMSEANRMLPKKEEESTPKVEKADLIPPLPPIDTSLIFPPSTPQKVKEIPPQPKKKKIRVSRRRKREVSNG